LPESDINQVSWIAVTLKGLGEKQYFGFMAFDL